MTSSTATEAVGLAAVARLLSDPTRVSICMALMDGRAWTAGELARHAGIARSSATEQINALVRGGLLVDERQGRHRYVRLSGWSVARLIEQLHAHTLPAAATPVTLKTHTASAALARARTCYDHLAGKLGVAIIEAMVDQELLDNNSGLSVTSTGLDWLAEHFGVDDMRIKGSHRPLVHTCLDWTERRPHLAGLTGAIICRHAFEEGWITRIGKQRAVQVTAGGRIAFQTVLDMDVTSFAIV